MEKKMENKNPEVFSNAPVPQAVLKNVLPAMAAMIMVLIYNLADTFFIGQTHDDILIAAVSLAMPVFLLFTAVGTIFGVGGVSVISRALGEGQAGKAMMGQLLGNLLNVILDPIMILLFGWGIAGAAIATVIGNVFGAVYYIVYFLRGKSVLSIHPRDFTVRDKVCTGVLAIGIPASLGSLLMSVSQIILNGQMAHYGIWLLRA